MLVFVFNNANVGKSAQLLPIKSVKGWFIAQKKRNSILNSAFILIYKSVV